MEEFQFWFMYYCSLNWEKAEHGLTHIRPSLSWETLYFLCNIMLKYIQSSDVFSKQVVPEFTTVYSTDGKTTLVYSDTEFFGFNPRTPIIDNAWNTPLPFRQACVVR